MQEKRILHGDPVEDQLYAAEALGYEPIVIDEWRLGDHNPALKWEDEETEGPDYLLRTSTLRTPVGTVTRKTRETAGSAWAEEFALKRIEDYRVAEWYLDQVMQTGEGIRDQVRRSRERIGENGLLCVRASSELGPSQENAIFFLADHPDVLARYGEKAKATQEFVTRTALEAGVDAVFFGGGHGTFASAADYNEKNAAAKRELSDSIKRLGGHSYYHD
jgi:hypothetical protein